MQIVRTDVHCDNRITLNVVDRPEIRRNFGGVDDTTVASGKLWILWERGRESNGFCLKMTNTSRTRRCSWTGSFPKLRQNARAHGNDISFIARIPLPERGIQLDKSPGFRIGHALLERFGDPRIIIFHNELSDSCPLAGGKGFELLDDFSGAHAEKNTVPHYSPLNRSFLADECSTRTVFTIMSGLRCMSLTDVAAAVTAPVW
jgi:hypothetical protein